MDAKGQLDLFDQFEQLKVPDLLYKHFQVERECLLCHLKMRHELHLFNHWKKYHMPKAKPVQKVAPRRYWKLTSVGGQVQWEEVSRVTHRMLKKCGFATAISKKES